MFKMVIIKNCISNLNRDYNKITIWSSNSTPRYMPQRIESRTQTDTLYNPVHSIIIHTSPKMETAQMPVDRRLDRQSTKCTYNGELFSHKKEWTRDESENITLSDLNHLKRTNTVYKVPAATAAKSLQSCPTLCDPIDGSPLGSSVPGISQARVLEWVAISFSKYKVPRTGKLIETEVQSFC